eukprot:578729-Heterocapsa_arctica.AAC.1
MCIRDSPTTAAALHTASRSSASRPATTAAHAHGGGPLHAPHPRLHGPQPRSTTTHASLPPLMAARLPGPTYLTCAALPARPGTLALPPAGRVAKR